MLRAETNNGCARIMPSTGCSANLPKLAEVTLAGVRTFSFAYKPLPDRSPFHINTFAVCWVLPVGGVVPWSCVVPLVRFEPPRPQEAIKARMNANNNPEIRFRI